MNALLNWFSQIGSIARFGLMSIPQRRGAVTATVFGIAGVVLVFVGVLSIAGPTVRLGERRMKDLAPLLREAAREVGLASVTSPLFVSRRIAADSREAAE